MTSLMNELPAGRSLLSRTGLNKTTSLSLSGRTEWVLSDCDRHIRVGGDLPRP